MPPPKPDVEASEDGIRLVCARFLEGGMTGREPGGGKSYHKWGGPKPFLGRGFMVCFPLPWVPPPCFSSENGSLGRGRREALRRSAFRKRAEYCFESTVSEKRTH